MALFNLNKMNRNESGFAPIIAVLALAGILVLGGVSVVGAANNSIPGDTLYSIDTGIEAVQLGLTNNPQTQLDLRTQFVAERLREAQQLLQEQGVGAPGIDVAITNLTKHETEINTLVSQNKTLQTRIKDLESQLNKDRNGLKSGFQKAGEDLETQLEKAKKSKDLVEADKLKAQLKSLEAQKEAINDDEDEGVEEIEEVDPEEESEPAEEKEVPETKKSSESKDSEGSEN